MYKEVWSVAEDTAKSQRDKVPDLIKVHSLKGGGYIHILNKYPYLGEILISM